MYLQFCVSSGESAESNSGGGSGGSIILNGNTVSVSGTISANGGNGNSGFGGGGAGGIIAIYYVNDEIGGTITSFGGSGVEAGGCGPVYTERVDDISPTTAIRFNNNNQGSSAACIVTISDDTYLLQLSSIEVEDNSRVSFHDRTNSDARVSAQVSSMTSHSDSAILYVGNRVCTFYVI